jgi:hypothetical protein
VKLCQSIYQHSEEGQTQNRRVEFLISANEKMKADAAKEAEKMAVDNTKRVHAINTK